MAGFDPSTFVPPQPGASTPKPAAAFANDTSYTPVMLESTDSVTLKNGIKCLVYGLPGMGKTRLIASAPAPVIISAERGLLSLRGFNLPALSVSNLAEFENAAKWARLSQEAKQFKTIALDSGSEIAEVILTEEKGSNKDGRKAYGEMQDRMVQVFRDFRNLDGFNVVFIAKQEFTTDGLTGGRYNAPMFPGNKLAQAAPYMFDEVWQLSVIDNQSTGEKERWLRTQPDNQNVAKDRSGMLNAWENADPKTGGGLSFLFNKMLGI